MDGIAWAAGILILALLCHLRYRSFPKACAIAAAVFTGIAIFIWPIIRGREISNIWPIAGLFQFVWANLVAALVGIPFVWARLER